MNSNLSNYLYDCQKKIPPTYFEFCQRNIPHISCDDDRMTMKATTVKLINLHS